MMANGAAGGGTHDAMMAGNVPGDAADGGTLEAAFGHGWAGKAGSKRENSGKQAGGRKSGDHLKFSMSKHDTTPRLRRVIGSAMSNAELT